MAKRWTEEEIDFLHEWYPEEGAALCAEVLDRTVQSVQNKAHRMGLKSKNSKMKTQEQYIIDVEEVTKNIIVLGNYVGNKIKILHQCTVCFNEWLITPNDVLRNHGCGVCAGNKLKTKEQYILDVSKVSKDIVVLGKYVNNRVKILHKCNICLNKWLVLPDSTLMGHGCPSCAGNKLKTNNKYLSEVPKEYEVLETYINSSTKILHKHKICGHEWLIRPYDMLSGKGCPICGGTKLKTHEKYQTQVPKDYIVLEQYKNDSIKIRHKHLTCGNEWFISPNHILRGRGCPKCAISGFDATKPAYFYWIKFENLNNLEKIGITNNINNRMKQFGYAPTIIKSVYFNIGQQAKDLEEYYLKLLKPYLTNTGKLKSGNTETFRFP